MSKTVQTELCIVQASIEEAPVMVQILTEAGQFKQDTEGYVSWDVPYPIERAREHILAGRTEHIWATWVPMLWQGSPTSLTSGGMGTTLHAMSAL